jgi:hypothetical protein
VASAISKHDQLLYRHRSVNIYLLIFAEKCLASHITCICHNTTRHYSLDDALGFKELGIIIEGVMLPRHVFDVSNKQDRWKVIV